MKTQLIFSIIFISMLILPGTLNAQATDPAAVAIGSFEAFNAGDSEASVAYYAEDAVVNVVPFGTHTGHEEIRAWMEKNIAVNGILTWETVQVDGDTVTLKSWYTDDELQAIGITLEADEQVTVKDGKIIEDTWVVTDESMAAMMAAMPPEAMPESGGTTFPYMQMLALGGLAILGGAGLALQHRRSR